MSLNTALNTSLNTAPIYDLLATVQSRIQRAVTRIDECQALPVSDPVRPHLIRLAYMVLDHHQAARRRIIEELEEAEAEHLAGSAI